MQGVQYAGLAAVGLHYDVFCWLCVAWCSRQLQHWLWQLIMLRRDINVQLYEAQGAAAWLHAYQRAHSACFDQLLITCRLDPCCFLRLGWLGACAEAQRGLECLGGMEGLQNDVWCSVKKAGQLQHC